MEGRYKVGEIMTENVIVATPNESVFVCAQKMAYRRVGALIIVDDVAVAGIITEQDIARKVVAKGLMPRATPVSTVMSSNVISINPSRDIEEAIKLMSSNEIKHLPVIDNGQLLGIITSKDIVAIEPLLIEILHFNNNGKVIDYSLKEDSSLV